MHSLCPCVGVARDRSVPEAFSAKPCGDSPAPGEEPTGTGPACSEPGDELGWNRARAFLSGASGVVAITRFTPQHPFQPGPSVSASTRPRPELGQQMQHAEQKGPKMSANPGEGLQWGLGTEGKLSHGTRFPEPAGPTCAVAPSTKTIP